MPVLLVVLSEVLVEFALPPFQCIHENRPELGRECPNSIVQILAYPRWGSFWNGWDFSETEGV